MSSTRIVTLASVILLGSHLSCTARSPSDPSSALRDRKDNNEVIARDGDGQSHGGSSHGSSSHGGSSHGGESHGGGYSSSSHAVPSHPSSHPSSHPESTHAPESRGVTSHPSHVPSTTSGDSHHTTTSVRPKESAPPPGSAQKLQVPSHGKAHTESIGRTGQPASTYHGGEKGVGASKDTGIHPREMHSQKTEQSTVRSGATFHDAKKVDAHFVRQKAEHKKTGTTTFRTSGATKTAAASKPFNVRSQQFRDRRNAADRFRDRAHREHNDRRRWFTDDFFHRHHFHPFFWHRGFNVWGCPTWGFFPGWFGWGWTYPLYYDEGYTTEINAPGDLGAIEENSLNTSSDGQDEWQPLGVFAVSPNNGEDSEATMFFQLAVSQDGTIEGTYYNTANDVALPVTGMINRDTQKAVFRVIGSEEQAMFETGFYNLTLPETPMDVDFGNGDVEHWLMVRM